MINNLDLLGFSDRYLELHESLDAENILKARKANDRVNLNLSYTDLEAIFNSDCLGEMENPYQIELALSKLLRDVK